jgi:hypothetical protein
MSSQGLNSYYLHKQYKLLKTSNPVLYFWYMEFSKAEQDEIDNMVRKLVTRCAQYRLGVCGALEVIFELGQALNGRRKISECNSTR